MIGINNTNNDRKLMKDLAYEDFSELIYFLKSQLRDDSGAVELTYMLERFFVGMNLYQREYLKNICILYLKGGDIEMGFEGFKKENPELLVDPNGKNTPDFVNNLVLQNTLDELLESANKNTEEDVNGINEQIKSANNLECLKNIKPLNYSINKSMFIKKFNTKVELSRFDEAENILSKYEVSEIMNRFMQYSIENYRPLIKIKTFIDHFINRCLLIDDKSEYLERIKEILR